MISPDPREYVDIEEFRQRLREWANFFFNSELMDKYQVAILYHDGSEKEKSGLPSVLLAHIIVNSTELKTAGASLPRPPKRF